MPVPALFKLLRPHQWIKNGFVLVGLAFSHRWDEPGLALRVLLLTAAFCAVSSAVYALNDVFDREADRVHPDKRDRPVASGAISVGTALAWSVVLASGGVAAAWTVSPASGALVCAYIAINIGYSSGLKHVAILDVFLIAAGFMLRILAGTVGVEIEPSRWLLGCGLMLTLFLGFAKRRAELMALNGGDAAAQRRSLAGYTAPLLDRLISISAAGAATGYALYALDHETIAIHGTNKLIWTLPFVLYGIFRYLYALHHRGAGADPAREVLHDPHLVASLAGWLGLTWWLIARG